jgi:hypothetical protein
MPKIIIQDGNNQVGSVGTTLKKLFKVNLYCPILGGLYNYPTNVIFNVILVPDGAKGYTLSLNNSSTGNQLEPAVTSFKLGDKPGIYLISAKAPTLGKDSLIFSISAACSKNVLMQKGWNMVSVPVEMTDMRSSILFSGKNSSVFDFENGYVSKDTLVTSKGYWVRYPDTATVSISGLQSGKNAIPVKSGWNMIGPYDQKAAVNKISTTPSGIITSQFFGFSNGYKIADTLQVGEGYWVRVSQNGELNITNSLAKSVTPTLANGVIDAKWGRITITDRLGNMSQLYVSSDGQSLSSYDLPPAPPSGVADVRWETNRTVEELSSGGRDIMMSGLNYPIEISVSGINMLLKDKSGNMEKLIRDGEKVSIGSLEVERLTASSVEIPKSYELYQNYPNPFNPTTKIKFGLPNKEKVRLEVYNVLGQRVEMLLDKELDAGYHEIEWKASKYASGMYIYRISAGSFTAVKKLILMK